MAVRFDPDRLTLDLSVADLLDRQAAGSLGFAHRGGYERLWLGQAIHSRYQEEALAADPSYRREVWLRHRLSHRGWHVTVTGRLDGLRRDPDGSLVVEEIKSVRRGGQLAQPVRELYQQQARLYAWMLSHPEATEILPGAPGEVAEAPPEIRAELVLIEIGSDVIDREPIAFETAEVAKAVKRRLNALIATYVRARLQAEKRREAAGRLEFPYPEVRPGQARIMESVETALTQREHLLLQATTGIGKTVAALYPALRHCLEHDKRLYVLTAKTLQQEMATQVLELLNREEAFRALRLRAKAKMCANGQVLCHEEYCPYAKDYQAKLQGSRILERLMAHHPYLDPDTVYEAAAAEEVCPFEVSLELAGRVQVTVCDYNYAFDPYVSLGELGPDEDLSDVVFVVDEVHNLVDRGRGYYSPELSAGAARRTAESLAARGESIHRRIEALCRELAKLVEETVGDVLEEGPAGDRAAESTLPEDDLWRLRPKLDAAFIDYLEHQRETKSFRPDDEFVELYFAVLRFLNALVVSDHSFSHLVERAGGDARWKVLCKDPSRFLGRTINRAHTTIGLSATLSPPEFYRDLLGFDTERTAALAVPNPFPADNRRVVIDSSVATTYRERPAYSPRIARRLGEFADSVPGNCLALFPSYAFLAEVAGHLELSAKRVLIQRRASGDREREDMLETLRSALLGDVLLLAVAGGVFAEGVDYPGDMLRAVAVVGPCLPALTVEQQLLRHYYDERFERGFEYAFVVPGMTRVVQAAGRLIRSDRDRGVIALFDRRFLEGPYRKHLPAEWLPEDGPEALAADPADAAAEFFGVASAARKG
ncbi:MAG: helicase C-terminal domain-containing protein [Thermoanaerobaculia bacterium]